MRYRCTKENPLRGEPGQRVEHDGEFKIQLDDGCIFKRCEDCGAQWCDDDTAESTDSERGT